MGILTNRRCEKDGKLNSAVRLGPKNSKRLACQNKIKCDELASSIKNMYSFIKSQVT